MMNVSSGCLSHEISYSVVGTVEGVKERIRFEQESSQASTSTSAVQNLHLPQSSRRRKGRLLCSHGYPALNTLDDDRPRFLAL